MQEQEASRSVYHDLDDPEPDWEQLERFERVDLPVVSAASAETNIGQSGSEAKDPHNSAYAVQRDLYHVQTPKEPPHTVTLLTNEYDTEEMLCICQSEEAASEGAASADCAHAQAVRQHRQ